MRKGVGQARARRATGQSCSDVMSYGDDISSIIFTSQVHLIVHLVEEAKMGDEVVAFVERYYGQNIRNERIPRVEDNSNYVNPISDTLFPPLESQ